MKFKFTCWLLCLLSLFLVSSKSLAQVSFSTKTNINYFYKPDTVSKLVSINYSSSEDLFFEIDYLTEYNIYTKEQTTIKQYSTKYHNNAGSTRIENTVTSEVLYNSFNKYYTNLGFNLKDSHRLYIFNCLLKEKDSGIDYRITASDLKLGDSYINPKMYQIKKYDSVYKDYCNYYIINVPSEIIRNITQVTLNSVGTVTQFEVVQNNLGMKKFVDTSVYYSMIFKTDDSKMSNVLINPEVYKEYVFVQRAKKALEKKVIGR